MNKPAATNDASAPRSEKYAKISACCLVLLPVLFACLGGTISCGLLQPGKHRLLCDCLALVCLLLPVLAFIFGIMALRTGRNGSLSPKGRRLARLCGIGSAAILLVILASMIIPHRHPHTDGISCVNELRKACIALLVYQNDHGAYPAETEWKSAVNLVFPLKYRQQVLSSLERICPGHHYIYWKPDDSPKTPEYNPPLLADAEPYHKGKHNVIYLDRHVDSLTPEEFRTLCVKHSNSLVPWKIVYVETGFMGPSERYTIDLEAEKITYEFSYTAGKIGTQGCRKRELPMDEVKKIKASLADFTAGNWENDYPNPPGVRDGTQWRLEIDYSDGSSRHITGSNNWPGDFNRLGLEEIKKKTAVP